MEIKIGDVDSDFELKLLKKQLNKLSFRLILLFLIMTVLFISFFLIGFHYLDKRLETLRQNKDFFPQNHPIQQKLASLSDKEKQLLEEMEKQRLEQEKIREELKNNNNLLTIKTNSLEKDLEKLKKTTGSLEQGSKSIPQSIQNTEKTLKNLDKDLKALQKENSLLKEEAKKQTLLISKLEKAAKEVEQLHNKNTALFEKMEKEGLKKSELELFKRNIENEYRILERYMQKKFQELEIAMDAALKIKSESKTPSLKEENLQE